MPAEGVAPLPAPVVNTPPVISGSPPETVLQNNNYTFTPTASDADGDNLVFSITNRPSWASFDIATGSLSGTPVKMDVGITRAITIRDLNYHRVHVGRASRNYSSVYQMNSGSDNTLYLDNLEPGTYFFAVTAVDTSGNESNFSAEVTAEVTP